MMYYIPFTVHEFANRFRMGSLSIPVEYLMEKLDSGSCSEGALRHFCGLFVEESDIIFVGFSLSSPGEGSWLEVPSWEVKLVHPISVATRTAISYRLGNCVVGEPVSEELRQKVTAFRNHEVASRAADFLMQKFDIGEAGFISKWREAWQEALDRYRDDAGFAPATLPEFLVGYERRKSFERSDLGFFEDSASIVKQSMLLPDGYVPGGEAGNNGHLDEVYALLRQMATLRNGWLATGNTSIHTLLREVAAEPVVGGLNGLIEPGLGEEVNTFAMMMVYLKFRALCRDINSDGGAARFELSVTRLLREMPRETSIALCLAGMRFGIHEFSAMFTDPAEIAVKSRVKKDEFLPPPPLQMEMFEYPQSETVVKIKPKRKARTKK